MRALLDDEAQPRMEGGLQLCQVGVGTAQARFRNSVWIVRSVLLLVCGRYGWVLLVLIPSQLQVLRNGRER